MLIDVMDLSTTPALEGATENGERVTRLQQQLAERDEIIVALQHVVLDLRHEIENLRSEHAWAALGHLELNAR